MGENLFSFFFFCFSTGAGGAGEAAAEVVAPQYEAAPVPCVLAEYCKGAPGGSGGFVQYEGAAGAGTTQAGGGCLTAAGFSFSAEAVLPDLKIRFYKIYTCSKTFLNLLSGTTFKPVLPDFIKIGHAQGLKLTQIWEKRK